MTPQRGHLALLAAIAELHPDRVAVVDESGSVTYGRLAAEACRVAAALASLGVVRGERVGVIGRRDATGVAAIHGVLASGAAYVPVDPDWPVKRQVAVLTDGRVSALVGDLAALTLLDGWPAVTVDRASLGVPAADAVSWPAPGIDERDPAYVLYTSGSTGAPKGVLVSHAAGRAFVDWAVREFEVTAADVIGGHAPFSFDISTFDLFASAATGATLVLVPGYLSAFPVDLAHFIAAHAITVWYSVPFPLACIADLGSSAAPALASLRAVLFAGEVFPPGKLARLVSLTPRAVHANLYGPTETNVCTFWRISEPLAGPVPIGRAIGGDACYVRVDGRLVRDEIGAAGELWVSGATLADGYWGQAEATAEAFLPVPGVPGGRAYRTGDLARVIAPGIFAFLGREDHLVKIRGVRIELEEIENVAASVPGVTLACAVTVPDDHLGHRLYMALVPGSAPSGDVARSCRARLPTAAVPEGLWTVAELPRTSSGKLDRPAIQAMAVRRFRIDGEGSCVP
jgi:L-proline---[L-prolyl-carrier protein] ligase